ncbi:hypothetical protein [uncultured Rhodospira sp.]|uniref:hypothetical protein n=1 Tax=uncultured Rhodospira sp. TaxID=1936189 RepID=UPI002639DCAD|nr:hypothetical protein [uncultured Rhodospira sp.]
MVTFADVYAAPKRIVVFTGWASAEPETGAIFFEVPLEISGIVQAGLFLKGVAFADRPDEHVSFEIALRNIGGRRREPLARLDWRPIDGGHTNQRRKDVPQGLGGTRINGTHLHGFDLNWFEDQARMRKGNLPIARAAESLESFEMARDFAGKQFGIKNMDIVQRPPLEYDLFHGPNA